MTWRRVLVIPLLLSLLLWGLILWGVTRAWSQSLAAAPACETIVSDHYRKLLTDQLVPPAPESQSLTLAQQLLTIASQLRIERTKHDIKKQQAELAEMNVAQLLEQLRQRTLDVQTLQAEVERLKNGVAPSSPAPASSP